MSSKKIVRHTIPAIGMALLVLFTSASAQLAPVMKLPDQGQRLDLVVGEILVKSSAKETQGAISQIVLTENPGYATALQSNSRTDISFYVLDGVLTLKLRDQVVAYPANSFVHIPKGTFFAHANLTNRSTRVFMTFSPGGFENYFFERANASKNSRPGTPAYSQTMAAIAKKYGVTQTDPAPFKNLQRL
jgi:quercetin dioxygenase-like cupin family protein